MSKKYRPNPLQFPEIVGIQQLPVHRPDGLRGAGMAHAPILKVTERQAKLDMVNETVEWVTEEKLVTSITHAILHVFN